MRSKRLKNKCPAGLDEAILGSMNSCGDPEQDSKKIADLLKYGAHSLVNSLLPMTTDRFVTFAVTFVILASVDDSNKFRFPAHDELGACRTSLVSPKQCVSSLRSLVCVVRLVSVDCIVVV